MNVPHPSSINCTVVRSWRASDYTMYVCYSLQDVCVFIECCDLIDEKCGPQTGDVTDFPGLVTQDQLP